MVSVPAPLSELPLLVRAGAVIATLPHEVDTLAELKGPRGTVRLLDRRRRLRLLAFPRGRSARTVAPGVRVRSVEGRRRWTLRVRAGRRHRFRVDAALGSLRRPFRPCRVTLGRRRLARRLWRYDRRARVLRARFRARRAILRARGCARRRRR
jgi:hypothetical protein